MHWRVRRRHHPSPITPSSVSKLRRERAGWVRPPPPRFLTPSSSELGASDSSTGWARCRFSEYLPGLPRTIKSGAETAMVKACACAQDQAKHAYLTPTPRKARFYQDREAPGEKRPTQASTVVGRHPVLLRNLWNEIYVSQKMVSADRKCARVCAHDQAKHAYLTPPQRKACFFQADTPREENVKSSRYSRRWTPKTRRGERYGLQVWELALHA